MVAVKEHFATLLVKITSYDPVPRRDVETTLALPRARTPALSTTAYRVLVSLGVGLDWHP